MIGKLLRPGLALCLVLAAGGAFAQAPQQNFRFGMQFGLTGGGDTLSSVRFTNGSTEKIQAGGLIHAAAGVLWTPTDIPFAGHLMFGYHVDNITADNGDLRFSRYPIEVLALYTGAGPLRLGAGLRYVNSPKLSVSIDGQSGANVTYDDTVGVIVEVGYQISPRTWLALRGTFEDYKANSLNGSNITAGGTSSGNSVGLYVGISF